MTASTDQQRKEATTKVKAWTGEEFLSRCFPKKEPLVENLLNRRDLVCLAARRRHGKTSFLTFLAVALATALEKFVGYLIPQPRRTLLMMLEDDPGEYQEKFRTVVGGSDTGGRIRIITRDDFNEAGVMIDVKEDKFKEAVRKWTGEHNPDVIVIDNLAHVIGADYGDAKRVHELMRFCYELARDFNAAVIIAAHPRKDDNENPVNLEGSAYRFFEEIMGTSHFINSTGSIWCLDRPEGEDHSVFLGGRQRSDGQQEFCHLTMNDNGWFEVLPATDANLNLVLNTRQRKKAWELLPKAPDTFGYSQGEELVKSAMSSGSTYATWMRQCRRLKVVLDTTDGRLVKLQEPHRRMGEK